MRVGGVLGGLCTVQVGGMSVLLGFFVVAVFMMMGCLMVMMGSCSMMRSSVVMMLRSGVLVIHGGTEPFRKSGKCLLTQSPQFLSVMRRPVFSV